MIDSLSPTFCNEILTNCLLEHLNSAGSSNQSLDSLELFQHNSNDSQVFTTSDTDSGRESETESSGKKVYHFFEGAEKLLEIWFTDNGSSPKATLRSIDR